MSKLGWTVMTATLVVAMGGFATTANAYRLKKTQTGGAVRWAKTTTEVELRISPEVHRFLPPGQAEKAIQMAAEAWRGFGNVPDIVVSDEAAPKYSPERRGGAIYVLKPWPFEDNRLAITVSSYYTDGRMVGVDVLINGEVDYAMLPESDGRSHDHRDRDYDDDGDHDYDDYDDDGEDDHEGARSQRAAASSSHDLAAVLTHEFGHVLGLDESYEDPTATMWPYVKAGETHQRQLSEDDEEAVMVLYAAEGEEDISQDQPAQAAAACAVSAAGQPFSGGAGAGAWPLLVGCLFGIRRYGKTRSVRRPRVGRLNR